MTGLTSGDPENSKVVRGPRGTALKIHFLTFFGFIPYIALVQWPVEIVIANYY